MFCMSCGTQIPESSQFCPQCGASMTGGRNTGRQEPQKVIIQHSTKRGHDASSGFGRGFGETLGAKFGSLVWGLIIIIAIIVMIYSCSSGSGT